MLVTFQHTVNFKDDVGIQQGQISIYHLLSSEFDVWIDAVHKRCECRTMFLLEYHVYVIDIPA